MMNSITPSTPYSEYYLSEYNHHDGESFITFNLIDVNFDRKELTLAITRLGKISHQTFPLMSDIVDSLYFEYGVMNERIYLNDFEEVI